VRISSSKIPRGVSPRRRALLFAAVSLAVFFLVGAVREQAMPTQSNSLPQITFRGPLVDLGTARAALLLDTPKVKALIESGDIRWVFDVARSTARQEIRILARSLADYQNGIRAAGTDDLTAILGVIFPTMTKLRPGVVATIRAATITRQFAINSSHCLNLLDDGEFKILKGIPRRAGVGGSPLVEFSSVVDFVNRRRVV